MATLTTDPPHVTSPAGGCRAAPVKLPAIADAIETAIGEAFDAMQAIERAVLALEEVQAPLAQRIESNRQRSERCRRHGDAKAETNGHDHRGDLAVKLTTRGLVLVCRSCGTAVTR
jgi:hypothetical protein